MVTLPLLSSPSLSLGWPAAASEAAAACRSILRGLHREESKLSSVSSPDGKGLRLPGAGERDPSRRDDKVGEVDVNRPVMVVEFYE